MVQGGQHRAVNEPGQPTDWGEYDAREAVWPYSARDETQQPVRYLDGLDAPFVRDWLGGDATEADLHNLAGVPLGARVTVSGAGKAMLAVAALGQLKMISRSGQEALVRYQCLVNVPLSARSGGRAPQVLKFHYCTSQPGKSGFGTDAVVRMVSACERLGLGEIHAILAGDGRDEGENSTGYYAWAALGFDAELEAWVDYRDRPLPEGLRVTPDGEPVETLQALFRTEGGGAWWGEHGSTVLGVFEVKGGSRSRLRLQFAIDKLAAERRGV